MPESSRQNLSTGTEEALWIRNWNITSNVDCGLTVNPIWTSLFDLMVNILCIHSVFIYHTIVFSYLHSFLNLATISLLKIRTLKRLSVSFCYINLYLFHWFFIVRAVGATTPIHFSYNGRGGRRSAAVAETASYPGALQQQQKEKLFPPLPPLAWVRH